MGQVTGRAFIKVNGTDMRSKEGATLNPGGVSREAAMSDRGVDGYSESPVAPTIQCSINHTADISLTDLGQITDASIVFETDTGKTYLLRNAWIDGPAELNGSEVSLNFTGMTCEEVS